MSHRTPTLFLRASSLALLCTLIGACSTSRKIPADTPTSQEAAAIAQQATETNGGDQGAITKAIATPDIQAQATHTTSNTQPATLSDSYAGRNDARQLASELAAAMDLDPQWTWRVIGKARYRESAARLMLPAPTGTAKNWGVYRSRFVEPIRIKAGVNFWRTYELDLKRAEATYGVPASVIAGVLGVETIYGRQTGNFRVLDVLATLSLDFPKGRSDRSAFFKTELGQFLKLCQEQGTDPESVLGSYAGAIGLPQFMPSSIRRYAVDFDGDGHIDLLRSPVDAIGSVAHYLSEHGWHAQWPAYFDITPPTDEQALAKLLEPDILPSFSASDMRALGASLSDAGQNHPGQLALVLLQNGRNVPTLIAGTTNFYAITRYNQSSYYALAVVQLGEVVSREASRLNLQNP
ncbi:MAG: lytic murein transglycosylase B [Aquabacterium sp.]|uniref:lytic murein transglycosylase B n=1 Tax=Aquabacterium sp. TaxID=1872578 RepID=UPI0012271240|nr:lytic murein transglycosylase B [Aquabacterium sp.]TAK87400.1 MAG: lytic murein transglycosylase B [Aquabacterium sp.]